VKKGKPKIKGVSSTWRRYKGCIQQHLHTVFTVNYQ